MFDPRKMQAIKNLTNLKDFDGSRRQAIKAAGFSDEMADNPRKVTDSKWFKKAVTDYEDEVNIVKEEKHAVRLDHYVFPLDMTDDEIVELIEGIPGCKMRKIKHGDQQTRAYFWTPDHKSRQNMLDKLWKLRGDYSADKHEFVDPLEGISDEAALDTIKQLEREIELRKERRLNSGRVMNWKRL